MNSHKKRRKKDFVFKIKNIFRKQILSKIDLINILNLRFRKNVFLFLIVSESSF